VSDRSGPASQPTAEGRDGAGTGVGGTVETFRSNFFREAGNVDKERRWGLRGAATRNASSVAGICPVGCVATRVHRLPCPPRDVLVARHARGWFPGRLLLAAICAAAQLGNFCFDCMGGTRVHCALGGLKAPGGVGNVAALSRTGLTESRVQTPRFLGHARPATRSLVSPFTVLPHSASADLLPPVPLLAGTNWVASPPTRS